MSFDAVATTNPGLERVAADEVVDLVGSDATADVDHRGAIRFACSPDDFARLNRRSRTLHRVLAVLLVASLFALIFLGGWLGPWLPGPVWMGLKTGFVAVLFVLLRAALPRPRWDQLVRFGWLVLLPLALVNLLATGALVVLRGPA